MKLSELFDDPVLETAGVGLVVSGVNTTPDVGPNEISKQARKWGWRVGTKGQAPKLRPDGKIPKVK